MGEKKEKGRIRKNKRGRRNRREGKGEAKEE
jgi:hypothetical protein